MNQKDWFGSCRAGHGRVTGGERRLLSTAIRLNDVNGTGESSRLVLPFVDADDSTMDPVQRVMEPVLELSETSFLTPTICLLIANHRLRCDYNTVGWSLT